MVDLFQFKKIKISNREIFEWKVKNSNTERAKKWNGKNISVVKATGNNLKKITADFPLGKFVCVTGVSGGGKSTLTIETFLRPLPCA